MCVTAATGRQPNCSKQINNNNNKNSTNCNSTAAITFVIHKHCETKIVNQD